MIRDQKRHTKISKLSNYRAFFISQIIFSLRTHIVCHVLVHRGYIFLTVLHLAGKGCVQEISVASILLAAVVVLSSSWWHLVCGHFAVCWAWLCNMKWLMDEYTGFTSIEKDCDASSLEELNLAFDWQCSASPQLLWFPECKSIYTHLNSILKIDKAQSLVYSKSWQVNASSSKIHYI